MSEYSPSTGPAPVAAEAAVAGGVPVHLDRYSPHPLAFFLCPDTLYPVYRQLASMLGPADLITLSRTCKALSGLYKSLLSSDWNIDRALTQARLTSDPKRFRSALNGANAVMSGLFALDFLDRNVTPRSHLEIVMGVYGWNRAEKRPFVMESNRDGSARGHMHANLNGNDDTGFVYIHHGDCDTVFRYLTEVEGYQLQKDNRPDEDGVFHRMGQRIRWHVELLVHSATGTRIKLASPTITDSALTDKLPESLAELIGEFAQTSGVNFITDDRAISLFPTLTYTLRQALPLSKYESAEVDWSKSTQSFLTRGIKLVYQFFPPRAYQFVHGARHHRGGFNFRMWYEDERRITGPTSWVLPLNKDGVRPARVPRGVVDAAYYNLTLRSAHEAVDTASSSNADIDAPVPPSQSVEISGTSMSSPSLRHVYCSSMTTPMGILFGDMGRSAESFACSQALGNRAEHTWHAHFDANIAASNALRIAHRDWDFRNRTRWELMTEVAKLSDGWFHDHEILDWVRDAEAEKRALPRREEGPMPIICVPGITTRGSIW